MTEKPWDGRFSEKTARIVEAFTASIDIDKRLFAHDIAGSIAHCRMLARAGIIAETRDPGPLFTLRGLLRSYVS